MSFDLVQRGANNLQQSGDYPWLEIDITTAHLHRFIFNIARKRFAHIHISEFVGGDPNGKYSVRGTSVRGGEGERGIAGQIGLRSLWRTKLRVIYVMSHILCLGVLCLFDCFCLFIAVFLLLLICFRSLRIF